MKHASWFKLALKGLGITLIALALATLVPRVAEYVRDVRYERMLLRTGQAIGDSDLKLVFLIEAAPAALQLTIGLYLLLGGHWIVNICIPSNRPYCPECGYDLSESCDPAACSECGTALPKPSETS